MREDGVALTKFTFVALFKACARLQLLDTGQDLYEELTEFDAYLVSDLYVGSILVDMYAKCGSIEKAQEVFDGLSSRSIASWSALMSGYAELGPREKALKCLDLMGLEGVSPDTGCYICSLKVCGDLNDVHKGHELHTKVIQKGLEADLILNHVLMDMYAKCGSLEETRAVFNRLEIKNVVSWTTLIARYVDHGFIEQALGCLDQMQATGVCPDDITLVCGLRACRDLGAIEKGRDIHTFLVREELEKIPYVCNTLIDFYVKQGSMEEAYNLFEELPSHDLILWTALMLGYVENNCAKESIRCFEQMQGEGLTPEIVVYNAVISASALEFEFETAVRLYLQMQECGILPDNTAVIGVLEACKNKSALAFGTVIHAQFLGPFRENETDTQLATIILDMYAKCGNMVAAQDVFDSMTLKDTVAWTSLISGYAGQGENKMIFGLLNKMMEEGISMDGEAFLIVLIACAHAGLVNEAQMIFESMEKDHSITPTAEHVNCLVDLLGRVGRLNEAVLLLRHSSISPDPVMWVTVLGACRKWRDIEVARNVFDHAAALDRNNRALFSLMSNIYADAGLWEEVRLIEAIRARQG